MTANFYLFLALALLSCHCIWLHLRLKKQAALLKGTKRETGKLRISKTEFSPSAMLMQLEPLIIKERAEIIAYLIADRFISQEEATVYLALEYHMTKREVHIFFSGIYDRLVSTLQARKVVDS